MNSHWENEGLSGHVKEQEERIKDKGHKMTQTGKNTNG
jgi:hypothetical protein